jgi:hypothetical protein
MRLDDCHTPLRREDSLECRLSGARDDTDALRISLHASTVAVAFLDAGQPLGFAGIVDEPFSSVDPRIGCVWLLTTEAARRRPLMVHRLGERFLAACGRNVLHNHVDATYASALRWLSVLGFRVAPPSPWGPFGAPFCAVEWRREWTRSRF